MEFTETSQPQGHPLLPGIIATLLGAFSLAVAALLVKVCATALRLGRLSEGDLGDLGDRDGRSDWRIGVDNVDKENGYRIPSGSSGNLTKLLKITIYNWFTYQEWRFSIAIYVSLPEGSPSTTETSVKIDFGTKRASASFPKKMSRPKIGASKNGWRTKERSA